MPLALPIKPENGANKMKFSYNDGVPDKANSRSLSCSNIASWTPARLRLCTCCAWIDPSCIAVHNAIATRFLPFPMKTSRPLRSVINMTPSTTALSRPTAIPLAFLSRKLIRSLHYVIFCLEIFYDNCEFHAKFAVWNFFYDSFEFHAKFAVCKFCINAVLFKISKLITNTENNMMKHRLLDKTFFSAN